MSRGSIRYVLRDRHGDPVPLDTVPALSGLKDADLPDGLMAAVPLQVFASSLAGARPVHLRQQNRRL